MDDVETTRRELERLATPICESFGVSVVDLRFLKGPGQAVVQIFLERDGTDPDATGSGVSIADCQDVSRAISRKLDEPELAEIIPGHFDLEVSSAGLERPLVKLADFQRFAGREAKLETREPIAGRRRFSGTLLGVEGDAIRFEQDRAEIQIPFAGLKKAHLVHRF